MADELADEEIPGRGESEDDDLSDVSQSLLSNEQDDGMHSDVEREEEDDLQHEGIDKASIPDRSGESLFSTDESSATAFLHHVRMYQPRNISIEAPLKPFLPGYIPAVGDVDELLHIPRPDGQDDGLGLEVLDEPAGSQSDPSVLQLKLRRAGVGGAAAEDDTAGVVTDSSNRRRLQNWIESVEQLHSPFSASVEVEYSHSMPPLDSLMQEWPTEVEQVVRKMRMPDASIDLDLSTLATALCSALGIPVHKNVCESLHVFYSLYYEMTGNPLAANSEEPMSTPPELE
jgi:intraflagellar transport protein 46